MKCLRPVLNLMLLPLARFHFGQLNPLCPADLLMKHMLRIDKLERQ